MKRGAEKQISKDDFNEDQGQEEDPQVGFTRADEAVLKTRPMRGLPKRASVASVAPPSTETGTTGPPKFNGFSGFGGANSFSGFSTTTPTTTNLFSAPTSTSTAKSLASFLASSPSPSTTPKPASSEPPVNSKLSAPIQTNALSAQKDAAIDPAELAYYTSLRGLNQSFRSAVGKAIDDDPFIDLVSVHEQYKFLRADIQKKFDSRNTSTTAPPSSAAAPITMMYAQTSGGFTFGGPKDASSTESKPTTSIAPPTLTPGSGFIPTFPSGSSSFIFGGKTAEPKLSEPKPSIFGTPSKDSDAPVPSLPFPLFSKETEEKAAIPSFSDSKPSEDKKQSTLPSTTPSFTASNNLFKTDSSSLSGPAKSDEKAKPLTFGSSFGTTSFSLSAPTGGFSFGSSSAFGTSASTPALKPSTDAPPPSTSRFAGFGGFGKPPTTTTSTSPAFGFSVAFMGPSASLATTAAGSNSELASSSPGDATTPTSEDAPPRPTTESFALNADNKHDQEGAGEEDEETVHSVKLKSYVLREDEDKKNWVEMGYGVLRIKKHKDTGARRVLLRSSSTGQILINFTFHSAFKPAQKAKNVTFLGYDAESKPKMYTLKTQTEPQARELKGAFDREMQAKEAAE